MPDPESKTVRKDMVKQGAVGNTAAGKKAIPKIVYAGSFDAHMKFGDKKGSSHSGLHIICEFRKANGSRLDKADILLGRAYTGRINKAGGGDLGATVQITAVDERAGTFTADVTIYGQAKTSTFFPAGTDLAKAKQYIEEAWKDHCTYGTTEYGGQNVDIYRQMRERFGLNWVGLATINAQRVWVGSDKAGSLEKAFPAVRNKFG